MGGELSYRMTGRGPLLVLLHPVGLDGSFWGGLPEACSLTHAVAAIDLRGHGRSPPSSRPGRMSDYVSDVAAVLDALGAGPAIVLGVSFGGMIAQHLASARPELVGALVLCGCPGAMPEAARDTILKRGSDAEEGGMEAVTDATLGRWFTTGFLPSEPVDRVRRRLLSNSASDWAAAWEAVSEHDALESLASFRGPALVIAGNEDAATPLAAKQALAAAIPKSRLAILKGAPHMMHIECEQRFAETVGGFLQELAARA